MARFDVYRLADGGLVLDCQNPLFDEIGTCFAIPLMPPGESPPTNPRLNPILEVEGERLVLVTQFATSLRTAELRSRVGSLADEHHRIIDAIDTLIGAG